MLIEKCQLLNAIHKMSVANPKCLLYLIILILNALKDKKNLHLVILQDGQCTDGFFTLRIRNLAF